MKLSVTCGPQNVAILIQPQDLRAMTRGWTPGMTPGYDSLPRQKKFRHDNTIRILRTARAFTSVRFVNLFYEA